MSLAKDLNLNYSSDDSLSEDEWELEDESLQPDEWELEENSSIVTRSAPHPAEKKSHRQTVNDIPETIPPFQERRCCICNKELKGEFAILFKIDTGAEARMDRDCAMRLNTMIESNDPEEINSAVQFMKSRYGAVDPMVLPYLKKHTNKASEKLKHLISGRKKDNYLREQKKSSFIKRIIIVLVLLLAIGYFFFPNEKERRLSSVPEALIGVWDDDRFTTLFPIAAIRINSDGSAVIDMDHTYLGHITDKHGKYGVVIDDTAGGSAAGGITVEQAKKAYNITAELSEDGKTLTIYIKGNSGYYYYGPESQVFKKSKK